MIGFFHLNEKHLTLPLKSIEVAQYVTSIRNTTGAKGTIDCISAACKWLNSFIPGINKMNDTLSDEFLRKVINSAKRHLAKPKKRKSPLTGDILRDIIELSDTNNLISLRDTLIPALAYSLLLRFDELSHICCSHIEEKIEFFSFTIPTSKNDQLRGGRILYLAKTSGKYSVSEMLSKYLRWLV